MVERHRKRDAKHSHGFNHVGTHSWEGYSAGSRGVSHVLVVGPQVKKVACVLRHGSVPGDGDSPLGRNVSGGDDQTAESVDGTRNIAMADDSLHGLVAEGEGRSQQVGCVVGGVVEVLQHVAGAVAGEPSHRRTAEVVPL